MSLVARFRDETESLPPDRAAGLQGRFLHVPESCLVKSVHGLGTDQLEP